MQTKYLLIGGGTSCAYAAASLRKVDSEGLLMIVSPESRLPYDRPPLSKQFLMNPEMKEDDPESKFPNFYPDNKIQLIQKVAVDALLLNEPGTAHNATLSDGSTIVFEKALIATGSTARKLSIPGGNLEKVCTLRSLDDAVKIRNLISTSKSAIVIGSGYVGLETASSMATRGLDVTVITHDSYPWKSLVSPEVGYWVAKQMELKGIKFQFNATPEEILDLNGGLTVVASDNNRYQADFVIAGIGADPNLLLAQSAGLTIENRGVKVNQNLRSSHPDVWISGDICHFPDPVSGVHWRAEHHLNAVWQANIAGQNLAGANQPYEKVAYFYSDVFDIHLAFRGCPTQSKPIKILGDIESGNFIEIWEQADGKLSGGTIICREEPALDPISDILEKLILERRMASTVTAGELNL